MRSGLHTLINTVLGMAAVVVVVVGVVLFLGRSGGALGDDLVFITRVMEIEVADVAAVGRDAFVAGGPLAERTLDVISVPLAKARVHEVYSNEPPGGDGLLVVRDPIRFGGLSPLLSGHTLVVAVEPLLDPTQDFLIDFQVRLVTLDQDGGVLGSDWEGGPSDQLVRLLAWGRDRGFGPGETLAMGARAVVTPTGSAPEQEILEIIGG